MTGLIPARAGKTPARRGWLHPDGAHPRAGGENRDLNAICPVLEGSSPRGRGKRWSSRGGPPGGGLIPARAGKTWEATAVSVRRRAHPRAGGENPTKATQPTTCNGSSPRGRGKQTPPQKSTHKARLIPARAGKTPGRSSLACSPSAHPRAGGENPRGRGFGRRLSRLIPARAGKTPSPPSPSTATQAHPRAGGEN